MNINFDDIFTELFNKGIIIAAVVARRNGEIVHISSNWNLDPADVKQCVDKWQKKSQFTKLQDRKYSLLMNTDEYFSGVNYKARDFLVGAVSPDDGSERYYVLGYAPSGTDGRSAYVDLVRAANKMKESGSYIADGQEMGKYDSSEVATEASSGGVQSDLQEEINGFLEWIKNPEGFSAYVQYYLDQNDPEVLAKIAKAYNDFRAVFGF